MTKEEGIKDLIDQIIALEQESGKKQKLLHDRYGIQVSSAGFEDYINGRFVDDGVRVQIYRGFPEVVKALGLQIVRTGSEHRSAFYGNVDICTVTSNCRMRKAVKRNNKYMRGEADGN